MVAVRPQVFSSGEHHWLEVGRMGITALLSYFLESVLTLVCPVSSSPSRLSALQNSSEPRCDIRSFIADSKALPWRTSTSHGPCTRPLCRRSLADSSSGSWLFPDALTHNPQQARLGKILLWLFLGLLFATPTQLCRSKFHSKILITYSHSHPGALTDPGISKVQNPNRLKWIAVNIDMWSQYLRFMYLG